MEKQSKHFRQYASGRTWLRVLGLGFLYAASGYLGLLLSPEGLLVTAMWPPLGLSCALLLLRGTFLWPGMLLGELLLMGLLGLPPLPYSLVALSNISSVLVAVALLRRFRFDPALCRIRDLVVLLMSAAISVLAVNAPLGAIPAIWLTLFELDDPMRWTTLSFWLGGDFISYLLFVPLICRWRILFKMPTPNWRLLEATLLFAMLFLVLSILVFDESRLFATSPSGFLLFPFVVWAGLRFGLGGAIATNLLIVCMVLMELTLPGFSHRLATLFWYPHFLSGIAATTLFLVVINEERMGTAQSMIARGSFFREVLDSLPIGVLVRGESGEVMLVNRFWSEVFGDPAGPGDGRVGYSDRFPEEQEPHGDEGRWEETVLSQKSGKACRMAFLRRQIRLGEAGSPSTLVLMDDETEVRQAEERARKTEVQLMAAIEGAEIGLWQWDLKTDKLTRHHSWYRLLGYSEEDFTADLDPWVQLGTREEWERVNHYYRNRLRAGESTFEIEYALRHRSGKKLWLLSRALVTERDERGQPLMLTGIALNVTESKRVQERLREAKEAAEGASEAKSFFLANISHEIRTPLNAIVGMASILMETDTSEEQREYLETIAQSSENLTKLITEVLDFSKIEAGNLELEQQEFPLRHCCEDAFNLLKSRAIEKRIEYELSFDREVDQYYVGDVHRLRQILVNLLSNSVKFTERGFVRLSVSPLALDPLPPGLQDDWKREGLDFPRDDATWVLFEVADSGIGIPQNRHRDIFESFTQGDATTTRRYGGTGLGLAICKLLTQALGGAIGLESEPGHGTTFRLALPLQSAKAFPGGEERSALPSHTPEVAPQSRTNEYADMATRYPCRILVAEDNETNRRVLTTLLSRYGYRPSCVANGAEALEILERKQFDLVLMDLRMPIMDGITATMEIRKRLPRDRQPRIVALTAHVVKGEQERCRLSGMDDFLPKPLSPEELRAAIRAYHPSRATT